MLDRVLSYYQLSEPMPKVVIEHPIQNVDTAGIEARADQIANAISMLLRR